MAIAAVPRYLGNDFSSASPGLRFGMYLRLWGTNNRSGEHLWTTHDVNYRRAGRDHEERKFTDENKTAAINEALKLTAADRKIMAALLHRQAVLATLFDSGGQLLRLDGESVAPFTTGLGNEHPLENGFSFLNPYGLPYLPGSGIKGVLRQAARELASGEWGDHAGWHETVIDILFGKMGGDGVTDHQRGALQFWDALPQIKGEALQVEVMTPHQSHYYQQRQSPHESGSPNPIPFITVPPGSEFKFFVLCDLPFPYKTSENLARDGHWRRLLTAAFVHAFSWLGFGAKTAVGYGQMKVDQQAERAREEEIKLIQEDAARVQILESLSPLQRAVEEALSEKIDKGMSDGVLLAQQLEKGRWQGEEAKAMAAVIRDRLKAEKK